MKMVYSKPARAAEGFERKLPKGMEENEAKPEEEREIEERFYVSYIRLKNLFSVTVPF